MRCRLSGRTLTCACVLSESEPAGNAYRSYILNIGIPEVPTVYIVLPKLLVSHNESQRITLCLLILSTTTRSSYITGWCSGNADSYSGDIPCEYRPGHRFFLLRISVIFLSPSSKMPGIIFQLGYARFFQNPPKSSVMLPFYATWSSFWQPRGITQIQDLFNFKSFQRSLHYYECMSSGHTHL